MPKRDTYESDDGFVEDAPKSKKQKGSSVSTAALTDDDGNKYWEISGTRRVQVSEFKGKSMVNIREFYEKDGKSLPGKKGIALPMEQYIALINLMPQIEQALQDKGITVPRPNYDDEPAIKRRSSHFSGDGDDDEEDEKPAKSSKKSKRKNHEPTDDEDED